MGKCETTIRRIVVDIHDDITELYVHIDAIGDCPIRVQGWHYKAMGAKKNAIDALKEWFFSGDYLSDPQKAPPASWGDR